MYDGKLLSHLPVCLLVQVFSDDKRDGEVKCPFGYLKASSSGNFVNLFIMPYNYPVLLLLIGELQQQCAIQLLCGLYC